MVVEAQGANASAPRHADTQQEEDQPRRYVGEHRMHGEGLARIHTMLDQANFQLVRFIRYLVRMDLKLAAASALTVGGVIFNVFALVCWTFKLTPATAWVLGSLGTAMWIVALGIFFFFLADPEPRHGRDR